MKKWYVVYTKENMEKKVTHFFIKNKISIFSPKTDIEMDDFFLNKLIKQEYIFKRNVFVQLEINQLSIIKLQSNIINFIYWLGRPVTISDFEMNKLKAFVSKFNFIKVEKTSVKSAKSEYNISELYNEYGEIKYENKMNFLNIPSIGYKLIALETIPSNQKKGKI